jgi:hypothetical protein
MAKNIEANQIGVECHWRDYNGWSAVEEDKEGENPTIIFTSND